jgi:Large eukaryotic DNA virus major capsid protein
LIRVHRQQLYNANTDNAQVLLQQLKWPVEYLFVGMKVKNYFASSSAADRREHLDKWHKFSSATTNTYLTTGQEVVQKQRLLDTGTITVTASTGALAGSVGSALSVALAVGDSVQIAGVQYAVTAVTDGAVGDVPDVVVEPAPRANQTTVAGSSCFKLTRQGLEVQTTSYAPTLDTVALQAHGIDIYKQFPAAMFNYYTTYHYGGPNVNTPEDVGALMIPFCLYPGTYQPSGHINVSRAREFYFIYTSSVIDGNNEGVLVVVFNFSN